MKQAVADKIIHGSTLVWMASYKDWVPFSVTDLATETGTTAEPPPMPLDKVTDGALWGLLLTPIIWGCIVAGMHAGVGALPWIAWIFNIIFVSLDSRILKKAGYNVSAWWVLFTPVYIIKRSLALKQSQWAICIYIVTLIIGAAIEL
jgi:hypothetical protein